jgi:hypothetical protein
MEISGGRWCILENQSRKTLIKGIITLIIIIIGEE